MSCITVLICSETGHREIIEQAEKISISLPASYKEGFTFEIDDPEACGCGDCFYHLNAYSSIFLEVDHGQADICAVDPGFIPVHESCLKLYKQYLRARLPGPIGSLDALHHLYDDGLHRVYKEYEHMFLRGPTFEPEKFPIWKEIDDLNGHFGPLDSFRLVESDQFQPDAEILDGFVYNATCRNRVSTQ